MTIFFICDWDNPFQARYYRGYTNKMTPLHTHNTLIKLTISLLKCNLVSTANSEWIINVQFTVELWACFHSININIKYTLRYYCAIAARSWMYAEDNSISLSFIWLNCPFSKLFKFTFSNKINVCTIQWRRLFHFRTTTTTTNRVVVAVHSEYICAVGIRNCFILHINWSLNELNSFSA